MKIPPCNLSNSPLYHLWVLKFCPIALINPRGRFLNRMESLASAINGLFTSDSEPTGDNSHWAEEVVWHQIDREWLATAMKLDGEGQSSSSWFGGVVITLWLCYFQSIVHLSPLHYMSVCLGHESCCAIHFTADKLGFTTNNKRKCMSNILSFSSMMRHSFNFAEKRSKNSKASPKSIS